MMQSKLTARSSRFKVVSQQALDVEVGGGLNNQRIFANIETWT